MDGIFIKRPVNLLISISRKNVLLKRKSNVSKQLKEKQMKIGKETRRKKKAEKGQKRDDKREVRKLSVPEHKIVMLGWPNRPLKTAPANGARERGLYSRLSTL